MRKLVLCCAAVASASLFFLCIQGKVAAEEKAVSHMDLVPHDAAGFVSIRLKDIWDDDLVKEFQKKLKASPGGAQGFEMMETSLGLELKQIDRLTFIMPSSVGAGNSPIGIVTSLKPLDKEKVKAGIVPKGTEKKTDSGKTYHEDSQKNAAVHFLSDTTFVVGDTKPLVAYLDKKRESKEGRFEGSRQLTEKHTVAAVIYFSDWGSEFTKKLPPFEGMSSLEKAKPAVLRLTEDKETAVELKLCFADEAAAKAGEKGAASVRDKMSDQFASLLKDLEKAGTDPIAKQNEFIAWAQGQATKFVKSLDTGLKDAKIVRKSQDIEVTCKAKVSAGQAIVGGFLMMFMPVKGPPPPPAPEKRG